MKRSQWRPEAILLNKGCSPRYSYEVTIEDGNPSDYAQRSHCQCSGLLRVKLSVFYAWGSDEERKRHDLAVERLQAAQVAWSQCRMARLDFRNEELRHQQHAIQTFRDVDAAMTEYVMVTGKTLDPLVAEPQLFGYYTSSELQKDHEITFILLGMATMGYATYKLI